MRTAQLHNVTLYVERTELDRVREFYVALFGSDPMWEERGHIACFGSTELAICVHEAEEGRPSGICEFFLWAEDLDAMEADLNAVGSPVRRIARDGDQGELATVDPAGHHVRVHRPARTEDTFVR
jgi:catechol 2,3-dioxygenase-like lactoylglutathione lyase family enzyme